jgi:hypothetical protein
MVSILCHQVKAFILSQSLVATDGKSLGVSHSVSSRYPTGFANSGAAWLDRFKSYTDTEDGRTIVVSPHKV